MWGEYLPNNDNHHQLKNTTRWQAIFVYFPLGLYVLFGLTLTFSITYEPIKYNISKHKNIEASNVIKKIYKFSTE